MTAEEEAAAKKVEADKAAEQAAAEAEKAKAAKSQETVSREEYDKLQADLENFKRIEEERKTKEKKRQEELLKEQGKFKDLYDTASKELEALKVRTEKLDGVVKAILEEEMKDLSEDFDKSLIPDGESLDQLAWIRKAKPVFATSTAADRKRGDGTPAPKGEGSLAGMKGIYKHPTSPKH